MGLLDSAFSSLPKSISGAVNDAMGTASFNLAGAATRVAESARQVANQIGENNPFSKIGANMPSIDTIKSAAMQAGKTLLGSNVVPGVSANLSSTAQKALFDAATTLKPVTDQFEAGMDKYTAGVIKEMAGVSGAASEHECTLTESGMGGSFKVVFKIMPEITEARTVQYEAVAPVQFPGAFQKYKGTDSVQWTINATFTARNQWEAEQNRLYINTLRGWTMPFFGEGTASTNKGYLSTEFRKRLGAPPPVLILKGLRGLVSSPIPVVITSLNWNWPKDVDYLPSYGKGPDGNYIPFPAVMSVAIQLVESFSTAQFDGFDLYAYRLGDMGNAFGKWSPTQDSVTNSIANASDSGGAANSTPPLETTNTPWQKDQPIPGSWDGTNETLYGPITRDEEIVRAGVNFTGPRSDW